MDEIKPNEMRAVPRCLSFEWYLWEALEAEAKERKLPLSVYVKDLVLKGKEAARSKPGKEI